MPKYSLGGIPQGKEPKVTFRIIRRCNFQCPLCSTFSGPDKTGEMELRDFISAVDILAESGFHGVLNISGGEPTLHSRLAEMLGYASAGLSHARIALFTNGYWIGQGDWRIRLREILSMHGVLIRFSLDRQHVEGATRALRGGADHESLTEMNSLLFEKARMFVEACGQELPRGETGFDFAFKGTPEDAHSYLRALGGIPIYLIELVDTPSQRPKKPGFLTVDVGQTGEVLVYPTLGHMATAEPLGGLRTLREALQMNRRALERRVDESE
jgi:hypothetical protein